MNAERNKKRTDEINKGRMKEKKGEKEKEGKTKKGKKKLVENCIRIEISSLDLNENLVFKALRFVISCVRIAFAIAKNECDMFQHAMNWRIDKNAMAKQLKIVRINTKRINNIIYTQRDSGCTNP